MAELYSDLGKVNSNLTDIDLPLNLFSMQAELDSFTDNHCNMTGLYRCKINADFRPAGWGGGGTYIVNGFKAGGYGWQEARSYWGHTYKRYCNNYIWADWYRYLVTSDLTALVQSLPADGRVGLDVNTTTKVLALYKDGTRIGTVNYT